MRVIAGRLGGRIFESPRGNKTHPMSDKVRGALFNTLGELDGQSVLDAFAGSGALCFEAISRGAGKCIALDSDKAAAEAIKQNAKSLHLGDQIKVVQANAASWLHTQPDAMFDIVLADPPYDDLQLPLIMRLTHRVAKDGLFVLSWPGAEEAPYLENLEVAASHHYGDAQLIFYRRHI